MKINARLQKIVSGLKPNEPVWDIGCDHGYVPLYALQKGYVSEAHLVDQVAAIIEGVERRVREIRDFPQEKIFFHISAGEDLDWTCVTGTVVIAGMGEHSIEKIMDRIPFERRSHLRLILAPENHPEELEQYLAREKWQILKEQSGVIFQKHRVRAVFIVEDEIEVLRKSTALHVPSSDDVR